MTQQAVLEVPVDRNAQIRQTRESLDTIDDTSLVNITRLSLEAVRALKQEVAEIFPASNLPTFLLQGLIQLEDRTIKQERVAADLNVLFRGTKQIGLYGTFIAAPASVLYGYQRLLALAGKDPESAFPDGPWQFYTQFGLREDEARHCIETLGFHQAIDKASELDSASCWVYAAMRTIFAYDDLLANEWHERAAFQVLKQILTEYVARTKGKSLPRRGNEREKQIADEVDRLSEQFGLHQLAAEWNAVRPYHNPQNAPLGNYAAYRAERFRVFLEQALLRIPADLRVSFNTRYQHRKEQDLPSYQKQMTLLSALQAESYQDQRVAIPLYKANIAIALNGRYYLLPVVSHNEQGSLMLYPTDSYQASQGVPIHLEEDANGQLCDRYKRPIHIDRRGRVRAGANGEFRLGYLHPPSLEQIKQQLAAIFKADRELGPVDPNAPVVDNYLAQAPRTNQQNLRKLLDANTLQSVEALAHSPIIINWNKNPKAQPLAELRQGQRGCGDHAMTILRTDRGFAFDLSHIFFDAIWGMALAEIMTGFAVASYPQVQSLSNRTQLIAEPLQWKANKAFLDAANQALEQIPLEACAETALVDLEAMNTLRKRLSKTGINLTVNDLLLLARCSHTINYTPGPQAQAALEQIAKLEKGAQLVKQITEEFDRQHDINPALLIPMDASGIDPRMRIFPATFRNPSPDLLMRLEHCAQQVEQLRQQENAALREDFDRERSLCYYDLQNFGTLMLAFKRVTMQGESFTMAALRLLGHLPGSVQNLVDMIPQKIGILNEILKGREVFSNVGLVASTSTLSRFTSARDDGATKLLVWGIMSNAQGQLLISLRDFRPHVIPLLHQGRSDLAHALAQDYLDSYAQSVNQLVRNIQRVLAYK